MIKITEQPQVTSEIEKAVEEVARNEKGYLKVHATIDLSCTGPSSMNTSGQPQGSMIRCDQALTSYYTTTNSNQVGHDLTERQAALKDRAP